jgi:hypothetical protein
MVSAFVFAATLSVFGSAGAESQLTPANTASPLNPRNVAQIPLSTNVADATAFIDATNDEHTWKVHLKLRADSSDRASDTARASEAFAKLSVRPWLDLSAGRMIEKWGTGYAWNPTAFVSPPKNPTDPNDRRASYRGVDAIKADVFLNGTSVSLYAMQHQTFAARAYRLIANTDVSLHVYRDRNGTKQGISAARVIGDALEIHGEIARRRVLVGAQYTFPRNVNVIAEIYRNGDGLTSREWTSFTDLATTDIRAANRAYAPLQMARNYSFVRVSAPIGRNDIELIAITNLRDRSSIARASVTRKLTSSISAYIIDTEFLGADDSELAYVQVARAATFGFRVYF